MKSPAALLLSLGLLLQGSALAAAPGGVGDAVGNRDGAPKKTAAYDVAAEESAKTGATRSMTNICVGSDGDCKPAEAVYGCGAFASHQKTFGFGFAATRSAAVDKALEACGQNECKVDSSGCQD